MCAASAAELTKAVTDMQGVVRSALVAVKQEETDTVRRVAFGWHGCAGFAAEKLAASCREVACQFRVAQAARFGAWRLVPFGRGGERHAARGAERAGGC